MRSKPWILVIAVFTFALAGCSSTQPADADTATQPPATSTAKQTRSTQEPTSAKPQPSAADRAYLTDLEEAAPGLAVAGESDLIWLGKDICRILSESETAHTALNVMTKTLGKVEGNSAVVVMADHYCKGELLKIREVVLGM